MTTLSRRQACESISGQARKRKSLPTQRRTSLNRLLSQVTAIPSRPSPGLAFTKASSTSSGVTVRISLRSTNSGGIFTIARTLRTVSGFARSRCRACPIAGISGAAPASDRAWMTRCRRRCVAPALGKTPENRAHIAAISRGQRTHRDARSIAVAAASRARRRPRRRTVTRTATEHKSQTVRADSDVRPVHQRWNWQIREQPRQRLRERNSEPWQHPFLGP
jgi:hypothetical protein